MRKWVKKMNQKYNLTMWLNIIFAFLIPVLGWNPLLILFIINLIVNYKHTYHMVVKGIYILLICILFILMFANLYMKCNAILQYFGFQI